MSRPLITVFGATGAQGGGLVRALLGAPAGGARAFRVRAVTRRPDSAAARVLSDLGAEICAADLDDPASVQRAMNGAHGAFCVTSYWEHRSPARELAQADAMARAAQRAGVRHVVWSTLEDTRRFAEPDGRTMPVLQDRYNVPHFDAKGQADQCFTGRGLPLTRLLTSPAWDHLLHRALPPRRAADGRLEFVLPMGEVPLPGIAAADIGACVAALFRQGEAAIGRRIGVAGEHLDAAQMAAALAQALGEPVRAVALHPADGGALAVPDAAELANMFRFLHDFHDEVLALRDVRAARALHPGLQDFATWLAAQAAHLPIEAPAFSRPLPPGGSAAATGPAA